MSVLFLDTNVVSILFNRNHSLRPACIEAVAGHQHDELQSAGTEGKGLAEAYEALQQAQKRVEDLYERWAELEARLAR